MAKLSPRDRAEILALATGQTPPRRRNAHVESGEQRLFVQRWRLDRRTRYLPACAVPNGGKRSKAEASILKAEGVDRGVPDWILFEPRRQYRKMDPGSSLSGGWDCPGLALEFKKPGSRGNTSPDQKRWCRELTARGWRVVVVETAAEAWAVVCEYLGITP